MKKRGSAKTKRSQPVPAAALVSPPPPPHAPAGLLGPGILIPAYCLLIFLGVLIFYSGRATVAGNNLSSPRSVFTAINAATLTGFTQPTNVNDYLPAGKAAAFALTILGILFTFIAGGLAVVRIARLPYSDRRVVACSAGSVGVVLIVGALFAIAGGGFDIVFQSLSAFGNSGLFAGELSSTDSLRTYAFLLPLSVLGGLGLPVLMEIVDRARIKSPLSAHARTVLAWTSGIYLFSSALLFLFQLPSNDASTTAWRRAVATASCEAINARSTGFPFEFATYWPRPVQWLTIALMIIGAGSAGTGGGIKVTSLANIFAGTGDALRRRSIGRPLGIALVWLGIYATVLFAGLLALLISEPQMPADRLLFLATSALGNVGLSHDPVSVSDVGLTVLSITMLMGRIAPVLILWWTVKTAPEADIATA